MQISAIQRKIIFHLGRKTKAIENVTLKDFKQFFNIIWMDNQDEKLHFKKLQLFILSITYCVGSLS